MNFTLTTPRNFNRIKEFTNSLPQTIRLGVCHGLNETGREMVKHTRKKMRSGPFTGRTYRIRGRLHIASATGDFRTVRNLKIGAANDFEITKSDGLANLLEVYPSIELNYLVD